MATPVTPTSEDQKNGTKMDRQTHQRSTNIILCPVRRLTSLVKRVKSMNCRLPTVSANTTLDKILLVVNKP
jgi:hypothetical protein